MQIFELSRLQNTVYDDIWHIRRIKNRKCLPCKSRKGIYNDHSQPILSGRSRARRFFSHCWHRGIQLAASAFIWPVVMEVA